MTESESVALPLGDTPMSFHIKLIVGWVVGFEPTHIGATTRGLNHLPTPTILATKIRLELTTSSVTGWHSNQLNYLATMQSHISKSLVGVTGLEPVTPCL